MTDKTLIELVEEYGVACMGFANDTSPERARLANAVLAEIRQRAEAMEVGVPDEVRVALDETRADLGYLFGRVAADGSFAAAAVATLTVKLDAVAIFHQRLAAAPTPKESSPVAAQDGEAVAAPRGSNSFGLDCDYFGKKMARIMRDMDSYKPSEFARECARMAATAYELVLREMEFMTPNFPDHSEHSASTVEALRAELASANSFIEQLATACADYERNIAASQQRGRELEGAQACHSGFCGSHFGYDCNCHLAAIAKQAASAERVAATVKAVADIWLDAQKPHEERSYVSGAFGEAMDELCAAIAKQEASNG